MTPTPPGTGRARATGPGTAQQQQPTGPSAAGTRRRLRALAARSWSPSAIEWETGIPAPMISRGLDSPADISPDLARAVAAAYDHLWDRDPPCDTQHDRQAADTISARAAASGWAPPLAWDDDNIDLPSGRPAGGWKPKRTSRRAVDLVEDAEFVRQHGGYQHANIGQIAMRLGVTRDRLEQAHVRARRYAARDAEPEAEAG